MKKLLPLLLALFGTAAGIGAGLVFGPGAGGSTDHAAESPADAQGGGSVQTEHASADGHGTSMSDGASNHETDNHAVSDTASDAHGGDTEYVKLNNQFVVPVVEDSRVAALVVLSISLEVTAGSAAGVFDAEPKLRDGFLRTLFDHANIGGFDGNFTETPRIDTLRRVLFETARNILGARVRDVLITDIARQDN